MTERIDLSADIEHVLSTCCTCFCFDTIIVGIHVEWYILSLEESDQPEVVTMRQLFLVLLVELLPISFGLSIMDRRTSSSHLLGAARHQYYVNVRRSYCHILIMSASYRQQHFLQSNKDDDIIDNPYYNIVNRQSDSEEYGRGIAHISADLKEGDVIAYQTGTWYVDGLSEVGDGSPPFVKYMMVDTIQLVWTHDCEHGVINGFDLFIANDDVDNTTNSSSGDAIVEMKSQIVVMDEYIQVGPEQILARIPIKQLRDHWNDGDREMMLALANFYPDDEIMKLEEVV